MMRFASPRWILSVAVLVLGCSRQSEPARGRQDEGTPAAAAPAAPLVPASATLERVNEVVMDPAHDSLPADPHEAEMVKLGYQIFRDTKRYAGEYVGNGLSCANCHLNAGQRDRALPLVGVAAVFPQYRSRGARLISLEDRIGGCFSRSMNGTEPPHDSRAMLALAAYISWLSRGQPMGSSPAWRGRNEIPQEKRIPIEKLDSALGGRIFAQKCAVCHGSDGQGVDLKVARPGPLWGPQSWNDGAGAARVYTLAGYVRYAMPLTAPGSLTDEEAQQVAAYINSQERPAFPGKAKDYPGAEAPVDAVYYPRYPKNPLRR